MNTYGHRLQLALDAAEKTRAGLANAIDATVQAIGQCIRGDTLAFTAENNMKAAKFLKVNPYWLATGTGDMYFADASDGALVAWPFSPEIYRATIKLEKTPLKLVEEILKAALLLESLHISDEVEGQSSIQLASINVEPPRKDPSKPLRSNATTIKNKNTQRKA